MNTVVNAAVAGVLLLPALSLTGDRATNLERSLEETLVALQSLAGLREELPTRLQGQPEARRGTVGAVLGSTEGPITDARVRDTLLATLRDDVGRLQTDLDRLRQKRRATAGGRTPPEAAVALAPTTLDRPYPEDVQQPLVVVPTVGLDANARARLSDVGRPATARSIVERRSDTERTPARAEEQGFSADRVRQGHALYRAERFAEALAALELAGDGAEPAYWRARCIERLDRVDEALAAYQALVAREDAGPFAERAKNDLEFLTWKREFGRRIDRRGAEQAE
jgi:hypothetical protein